MDSVEQRKSVQHWHGCFPFSTKYIRKSPFLSDNFHPKLLTCWVDSMFSAISAMYVSDSQLLTYVRTGYLPALSSL